MNAPGKVLRHLSLSPQERDVARIWDEAVACLRIEYVQDVRRARARPTYHLVLTVEHPE